MKKGILSFIFTSVLLIILLSNTTKVDTTGAPIASTGAPGENTCSKSGCHTGSIDNAGNGKLNVKIHGLKTNYIPDKIYEVTITLTQENIKRFGFAFSAYNSETNAKAGNLIVSDEKRTQVMEGANQYIEREYITYKSLGTNPYKENTGKWTFNWKAPSVAKQPISFYIAAVAADNDGTDSGDLVYTHAITLGNKERGKEGLDNNTAK